MPYDLHRVSPNQRLHPMELARRKRVLRQACLYSWQGLGCPRVELDPGEGVRISFTVRRARSLDNDNIVAAAKSAIDQLAVCLALPNDSARYVSIGLVRQEIGKKWKGKEEFELLIEAREE